jgi:hypothetical protein
MVRGARLPPLGVLNLLLLLVDDAGTCGGSAGSQSTFPPRSRVRVRPDAVAALVSSAEEGAPAVPYLCVVHAPPLPFALYGVMAFTLAAAAAAPAAAAAVK